MRRITLFIVTLFFTISYTFAQQVTINYKNGQNTVINVSEIESIDFSNTSSDGTLPKILIGVIVLSSDPSDPADLQTVLADDVISDAIQKGKDSNGTKYLIEKELNEVLFPKYVRSDPSGYRYTYSLIMIPNIADYSQYEGGFLDGYEYYEMSFFTPTSTFFVFNGTLLTYKDMEYRVYGTYSSKIKGFLDLTVHTK